VVQGIMTKHGIFILSLLAQVFDSSSAVVRQTDIGAISSLRIQSNDSIMTSFSQSIWNTTISNFIQKEFEVQQPLPSDQPQPVNKFIWLVLAWAFGFCGFDRCFMGQIILGVVKGCTLGGLLVWAFADYGLALVSALLKEKEIHVLGYDAVFEEKSVKYAYYLGVVLLVWSFVDLCYKLQAASNTRQCQAEQQKQFEADIPTHHQALVYMPTRLAKGLRTVGLVPGTPTIPELITVFEEIDKDGDGQLDRAELEQAMRKIGASDSTVEEMIKEADVDGDGKISKQEFLQSMVKAQTPSTPA